MPKRSKPAELVLDLTGLVIWCQVLDPHLPSQQCGYCPKCKEARTEAEAGWLYCGLKGPNVDEHETIVEQTAVLFSNSICCKACGTALQRQPRSYEERHAVRHARKKAQVSA